MRAAGGGLVGATATGKEKAATGKEKAGGKPSEPDWGKRSVRQRWASANQSWSEQWRWR